MASFAQAHATVAELYDKQTRELEEVKKKLADEKRWREALEKTMKEEWDKRDATEKALREKK